MRPKEAAMLIAATRRAGDELVAVLAEIKDTDPAEFEAWKASIGKVMGEMYTELLAPLFVEHPQLVPEALKLPQLRRSRTSTTQKRRGQRKGRP